MSLTGRAPFSHTSRSALKKDIFNPTSVEMKRFHRRQRETSALDKMGGLGLWRLVMTFLSLNSLWEPPASHGVIEYVGVADQSLFH